MKNENSILIKVNLSTTANELTTDNDTVELVKKKPITEETIFRFSRLMSNFAAFINRKISQLF